LTLLAGQQEGHPACKKTEWWGTGVVICLERGANEIHNISTIRTESVTSPQLYNKSNERRLSITKQRPDLTENVRK